jgi:hypothetical protein
MFIPEEPHDVVKISMGVLVENISSSSGNES